MPIALYAKALQFPQVKILILETFGAGNAFSTAEFQAVIQGFIADGGLVLNITQCQSGAVRQGAYQTSTFFEQIGVVSGADLTAEAALTKSMFALANIEAAHRGHFLKSAIVGELTTLEKG
jgi:L-asparaginase